MKKVTIKNRLTDEVTWITTFETEELANAWIAFQEGKKKPFGYNFGAREVPKKGLGYDKEVDYEDALVDSEFQKTILEAWTENVVDEEGNPTGETIEHDAIVETWVNLFPEYEIVTTDITEEWEVEQDEIEKINLGKLATDKCQRVLNYISGYNLTSGFTLEQITAMQNTFADVESALRAGRPDLALIAVNNATPDGEVVTNALKDKIISMLNL